MITGDNDRPVYGNGQPASRFSHESFRTKRRIFMRGRRLPAHLERKESRGVLKNKRIRCFR